MREKTLRIHLSLLIAGYVFAGIVGYATGRIVSENPFKKLTGPCFRVGEKIDVREHDGQIVTYMCLPKNVWMQVKYQDEP